MENALKFTEKSLVVISGASRGIGATLALEFAKLLENSTIVLLARSPKGLDCVKTEILSLKRGHSVVTSTVDLSQPDLTEFNSLFSKISGDFLQKVIIHNAGQVGVLDKTTALTDLKTWRSYYDLNLFSVALLNSAFLEKLPQINRTFVVNITSLCGSVPFSNMAMYGSGKAARNLFFKVLAAEEPNLVVLNYSPGPVDTDMVTEVISNMKDEKMKIGFVELKEKKTILTTEQTTKKLLGVLEKGEFKSGDVVDYFDRV